MDSALEFISGYLPQSEGLLPKWLLLVASLSVFNTAQNLVTVEITRKMYNKAPLVTALQGRTFAIWTMGSALVRGYAAYNIHDKAMYDLALLVFLLAFAHFTSELFIFRSASLNPIVISPVIVSTVSLVWMVQQYDFYVDA